MHPARSPRRTHLPRRDWLKIGFAAGLAPYFGSNGLKASPSMEGNGFGKAKSVIFLFHLGGPPQHETWDPKPQAPAEVKGEFAPTATKIPGLHVSELMPQAARRMNDICVLRSCTTADNAHSSSGYWMLTGVPHIPMQTENAKVGFPNDHPSLGSAIRHVKPDRPGLPSSITIPEHIWNTGGIPWPGQDAGFLGRICDPWLVHCDPSKKGFSIGGLSLPEEVSIDRVGGRADLLSLLESHISVIQGTAAKARQTRDAFAMIRSGPIAKAFRIDEEPMALRERYGSNRWGQSLLLARRLVEAQVPFIQVNWTRMPGDTDDSPAWDTHARNGARCKDHLLPISDLAFSALLDDLKERGLLDSTMIVWTGEFGRSPRHNPNGGRDHWGHAFSSAICGAGIRGGQVLGATDKMGAFVKDDPIAPQDLHATILHGLGIPEDMEIHDPLNRPLPICRGKVLAKAYTG